jgi:hypothetical protein
MVGMLGFFGFVWFYLALLGFIWLYLVFVLFTVQLSPRPAFRKLRVVIVKIDDLLGHLDGGRGQLHP